MWLKLYFKRLFKTPFFVFILVIFPIFSYFAAVLEKQSDDKNIIGIFFENNEYSEDITQKLNEVSTFFDFVTYQDPENMKNDVINGTLHCGYVFGNILDTEEYSIRRGSIKCIKRDNSALTGISDAAVFSVIQALYGYLPEIQYAREQGFTEMSEDNMREKYFFYSTSDLTYSFIYEMIGSEYSKKVESNSDANSSLPIRAIGAVIIMLSALFGAVRCRTDYDNGIQKRLYGEFAFLLALLNVFTVVLPACVSAFAAIYLSGTNNTLTTEISAMLLYMVLAVLFGSLIAHIFKSVSALAALAPIMIIGTLIFCPIFIDAEKYVPMAGIVNKLFLPYYYFCMFKNDGILWSITAFSLLAAASLFVFLKKLH